MRFILFLFFLIWLLLKLTVSYWLILLFELESLVILMIINRGFQQKHCFFLVLLMLFKRIFLNLLLFFYSESFLQPVIKNIIKLELWSSISDLFLLWLLSVFGRFFSIASCWIKLNSYFLGRCSIFSNKNWTIFVIISGLCHVLCVYCRLKTLSWAMKNNISKILRMKIW